MLLLFFSLFFQVTLSVFNSPRRQRDIRSFALSLTYVVPILDVYQHSLVDCILIPRIAVYFCPRSLFLWVCMWISCDSTALLFLDFVFFSFSHLCFTVESTCLQFAYANDGCSKVTNYSVIVAMLCVLL